MNEFGAKQVRQHFEPKYIKGEAELHCKHCQTVFQQNATREALEDHWRKRHDVQPPVSVPHQEESKITQRWRDEDRDRRNERMWLG
jgi:hypothetical protein